MIPAAPQSRPAGLTWDDVRWRCYSVWGGWWVEMWPASAPEQGVVSAPHWDLWAALADAAQHLGLPTGREGD